MVTKCPKQRFIEQCLKQLDREILWAYNTPTTVHLGHQACLQEFFGQKCEIVWFFW